ncbi:hypothetical protein [Gimesia panareensis]|uniref:hypothetical protein n=1 Tax=Gimesia panareensis TaxID=2527978 RepID=UPI00118B5DC7|nr:hypothetical protein [Gimesia panareensis]QDU52525.1 hypothetical protein Pan110_49050 [Gimesia panareensis]
MSRLQRSKAQLIWFRVGLACVAVVAVVFFIQLQKPKVEETPPPAQQQAIRYDILNDIDQAPARRMLEIMLSKRISERELELLSHQIRDNYPYQQYKEFSISYLIPNMSKSPGYWARVEYNQGEPEKINILGTSIPELQAFQQAPAPPTGQVLGDWLIEETANASRRVVITKDQGKYYYQMQWSPDSEFKSEELKPLAGATEFAYQDKSKDTIFKIQENGDLELSGPDGVFAVGHPLNSYKVSDL